MFGGGIGKVAPDLAPAAGAIGILDPDEDRDPLGHGAEGGANRLLDGRAEDVGFDARECRPAHCLMVLPSPGFAPMIRKV